MFLVRKRHARAREVELLVINDRAERGFEMFPFSRHWNRQEHTVVVGFTKARVVKRGRTRVRDWPTDDAKHFRRWLNRVEAIEIAQFTHGGLAWRSRGAFCITRKGEKPAKFRGKHATHESELAHEERDGGLGARGENVEGFEIVADAARGPCDFHNAHEWIFLHRGNATHEIRGSTEKVM